MTITSEAECLEVWGTGPVFEIVLHEDLLTCHGNVVATAGTYNARQSAHGSQEGVVTIWSPNHYTGPMSVSVPVHKWSFVDEGARPMPAHDCWDEARSGVAGGVFCGLCRKELG